MKYSSQAIHRVAMFLLFVLAIALGAIGYYLVIDGTINQASQRFILPREIFLGSVMIFLAGLAGGAGLYIQSISESRTSSVNRWLQRKSHEELKKMRNAALLMVLIILAARFVEGASKHSIIAVDDLKIGLIGNLVVISSGGSLCGAWLLLSLYFSRKES